MLERDEGGQGNDSADGGGGSDGAQSARTHISAAGLCAERVAREGGWQVESPYADH